MRKQMLKGFTMLLLVVALALVTAVASANGQSSKTMANIPFEFVVGDKALPAGAYTVDSITSQNEAMIIRNVAAKDAAFRLTTPASGQSKHAKLVFHRYGERYFLAEVWAGEGGGGRELMKSRQERAIERELAKISSNSDLAQSRYERVEILATVQ
jgi:hypothetical protein